MHFVFKQAICFDKKDYSRGVHELPESVLGNKVFRKFFDLGLIVEKEVPVMPEFIVERNKKLAEQFDKANAPAPVAEEAPAARKSKKQK